MAEKNGGSSATPKKTPAWVAKFLARLAEGPNVAAACKAGGIARSTAYRYRKNHPDFAEAWDETLEDATDLLAEECWKRAVYGTDGSIKYSDTLAIFLLKKHRPAVYDDKPSVHVHSDATPDSIAQAIKSAADAMRGTVPEGEG